MIVTIKGGFLFLDSFSLLAFLRETDCVLFEVQTEVLYTVEGNLGYPITFLDGPLGHQDAGVHRISRHSTHVGGKVSPTHWLPFAAPPTSDIPFTHWFRWN
jgi:hypothetical protein